MEKGLVAVIMVTYITAISSSSSAGVGRALQAVVRPSSATSGAAFIGSRVRSSRSGAVGFSSSRLYSSTPPIPVPQKNYTDAKLDWDTFEFSDNPKQDARFGPDASHIIQHADDSTFHHILRSESEHDDDMVARLSAHHAALSSLDPTVVARATTVLSAYATDARLAKLDATLRQRTRHCRFLFENPANPSNVWACLRTVDSFGIQHVDVVVDSATYTKKQAVAQKRGTRTAMGSAQWITLHQHKSTTAAVHSLRQQGYRIYASDLNEHSEDVRTIDWGCSSSSDSDDDDDRPVCIVMGNEDRGISQEMREAADKTFVLPMVGFAESFNLSVATAITLAHLSARGEDGPIRPGDLDEHEFNCLKLKWVMNSLAQKKMARALLKREGIDLPHAIDDL